MPNQFGSLVAHVRACRVSSRAADFTDQLTNRCDVNLPCRVCRSGSDGGRGLKVLPVAFWRPGHTGTDALEG